MTLCRNNSRKTSIFGVAFVLVLVLSTVVVAWTISRNPSTKTNRFPIIAKVRFTIRNITSVWEFPSYYSTTGRSSVTVSSVPVIVNVDNIKKFQCNPQSCKSDDLKVLEHCDDFCLQNAMNSNETGNQPAVIQVPESIIDDNHDDEESLQATSSKNPSKGHTQNSTNCDTDGSDPNCTCNYELAPVCGTNSKTYSNLCSLECAKKCNPSIEFLHVGKC